MPLLLRLHSREALIILHHPVTDRRHALAHDLAQLGLKLEALHVDVLTVQLVELLPLVIFHVGTAVRDLVVHLVVGLGWHV